MKAFLSQFSRLWKFCGRLLIDGSTCSDSRRKEKRRDEIKAYQIFLWPHWKQLCCRRWKVIRVIIDNVPHSKRVSEVKIKRVPSLCDLPNWVLNVNDKIESLSRANDRNFGSLCLLQSFPLISCCIQWASLRRDNNLYWSRWLNETRTFVQ